MRNEAETLMGIWDMEKMKLVSRNGSRTRSKTPDDSGKKNRRICVCLVFTGAEMDGAPAYHQVKDGTTTLDINGMRRLLYRMESPTELLWRTGTDHRRFEGRIFLLQDLRWRRSFESVEKEQL